MVMKTGMRMKAGDRQGVIVMEIMMKLTMLLLMVLVLVMVIGKMMLAFVMMGW